jgi:hypothetical protein
MGGEKVFKTLRGFSRSVLPFIEIIILSFVAGIALGNSGTAVVTFLLLIVIVYIWPTAVRSIAWGVITILILNNLIPNQSIYFQILVGVIIGGLRYLVIRFTR